MAPETTPRAGTRPAASGTNEIHLGEPGFLNTIVRRRALEGLFLFVTSRCNSRCRTCFYSQELNSGEDLSFEQIRRVSRTAPRFDKLWLSGGEPFLREDLVEIIAMFCRNNGVRSINLPTNGLLGTRVVDEVSRLLEDCPRLTVHLNFSLDGMNGTHDSLRGVPGAFERTIATMEAARERFESSPRVHRNVATVVTREALSDMVPLAWHLHERGLCTTQYFETVRGSTRDPLLERVTRTELEWLHRELEPLYVAEADRLFNRLDPRARWLAKLYFQGFIGFCYRLQEENLEGPTPWGMDCTAGATTIVIDHDGRLRACELRAPFAHLRDFDFDMSAALGSQALADEIRAIGGGRGARCWCTHSCWIMASMQFSPRTLALRIPWSHPRNPARDLPDLLARRLRETGVARTLGLSQRR